MHSQQPVKQGGVRKGFTTIDHILALNQTTEKTEKFGTEVWLLYTDFNNAFDSIYDYRLWEALAVQAVPEKITGILSYLYAHSEAYIELDTKGTIFLIQREVKQGDPLSPNLFNRLLEQFFGNLKWKRRGLQIAGKSLSNLRLFADDIVLIARNPRELAQMSNELKSDSEKFGLTMNQSKTKFMANQERNQSFVSTGPK